MAGKRGGTKDDQSHSHNDDEQSTAASAGDTPRGRTPAEKAGGDTRPAGPADGTGRNKPADVTNPNGSEIAPTAPVVTEFTPIADAPGAVSCSPIWGLNSVIVEWMPPNEGPADGYTVELVGIISIDAPGTATRVQFDGLAEGSEVTARVTARRAGARGGPAATGALECPAVIVNQYLPIEGVPAPTPTA